MKEVSPIFFREERSDCNFRKWLIGLIQTVLGDQGTQLYMILLDG